MANGNSFSIGDEKNMRWWLAVIQLPRRPGTATRAAL